MEMIINVLVSFADSATRKSLLSWLPGSSDSASSMDLDAKLTTQEPAPEVETYLRLLIIYILLNSSESYGKALQLAKETGGKILQLNRRSMDPIAAKVWYAVDRAYELGGELADARPYVHSSHIY
jgi:26S proteasome regulatory subunit N3